MSLIEFEPQLIKAPFFIRYPGMWYAREETSGGGDAGLFFTKEPIRDMKDQYTTGAALYSIHDYFLDKAGMWENRRSDFRKALESQGVKILSVEDVSVFGRESLRIDYEKPGVRVINVFIKIDNSLYTVVCESPSGEFEDLRDTFQGIIGSMKWAG